MHYYKFNISKWHLSTSHLSLEEEAVYFRLINYYYDTESPIPLETQSVIRRLRLGNHSDIVDTILHEFFTKTETGWVHEVCEELIADYHSTAEKNKKNGKSGGRPRKNKDLETNPKETQSVSKDNPSETLTNNYKLKTNNYINTPEGVSDSVFNDYLKIRKAQKKPWTATAQKLMEAECKKAGISLQEAMEMCCARGWIGFKAEWCSKATVSKNMEDKSWQFSNEGIVAKANELGLRSEGLSYQQLKDKCLFVLTNRALQ